MSRRITGASAGAGPAQFTSGDNNPSQCSNRIKLPPLDEQFNQSPWPEIKRRRTHLGRSSYGSPIDEGDHPLNHAGEDLYLPDKPNTEFTQQQISPKTQPMKTNKHLIRTLDLPVFVTIEGHRVASYCISGEPYLCLPQLIHFIQKSFPHENVIPKFEESLPYYVQATPKQLAGFKRAMVLPVDVETCSLVRRSDAEWICLALFDQLTKENWSDIVGIVDLCSKPSTEKSKRSDSLGSNGEEKASATSSKVNSPLEENSNQINHNAEDKGKQEPLSTTIAHLNGIGRSSSNLSSHVLLDLAYPKSKSLDEQHQQHEEHQETHLKGDSQTSLEAGEEDTRRTSPNSGETSSSRLVKRSINLIGQRLFKNETQGTILTLAKQVTSTLIIHVYHRCFGKCTGLYYPVLLREARYECIECSRCHKMLSPRRFIGHTHGSKERNVCHWGFNSYHWRDYIRLSRKQIMNHLDDDELLLQFNLLKSMSGGEEVDPGYLVGEPYNADVRPQAQSAHPNDHHAKTEVSYITDLTRRSLPALDYPTSKSTTSRALNVEFAHSLPALTDRSNVDSTNISNYTMRNSINNPYLWVNMGQAFATPAHNSSLPACLTQNHAALSGANTHSQSTSGNLYMPSTSSSLSNMNMQAANHQSLPSHLKPGNPTQIDIASLRFLSEISASMTNFSQAPPATSVNSFLQTPEQLARQDVFLSTSLRGYLIEKGLPPSMIDEMVGTTLAFINRSRMLF